MLLDALLKVTSSAYPVYFNLKKSMPMKTSVKIILTRITLGLTTGLAKRI